MAMVRSALGRVSRRLFGSLAAPSVMFRRGPEILQAPPPLPSLRPAVPWMPRTGPAAQLMRTFTSPAVAAAAARTHRIPNLRGWQHFPAISKGTKGGVKFADQKRFLAVEREDNDAKPMQLARRAVKSLHVWLNGSFDPRNEFLAVTFFGVVCFVWMTIVYAKPDMMGNNFISGKDGANDVDRKDVKHS